MVLDVGSDDLDPEKQVQSLARSIIASTSLSEDVEEDMEKALRMARAYMSQARDLQIRAPHAVPDARRYAYRRFLFDLEELTNPVRHDSIATNRRPKRLKDRRKKRRG